jgi:hypothetical protein
MFEEWKNVNDKLAPFLCLGYFKKHFELYYITLWLKCACNYYYYLKFSLLSFQLGNIHLSWDLIINRNRFGGLIYNLESFLQLNMCQELQIFAFVYMYLVAS